MLQTVLDAEMTEHYGDAVQQCWFAHPDVVDKLSALQWAWKGSYCQNAKAPAPGGWQTNQVRREHRRPECERYFASASGEGIDW